MAHAAMLFSVAVMQKNEIRMRVGPFNRNWARRGMNFGRCDRQCLSVSIYNVRYDSKSTVFS